MRHSLIALAVFFAAVLLVGPARSQADFEGLDILFLVDQSGSMGGAAFDYPDRAATDPLELRFEAVQYAIDTLGEYRLNIAPDTPMRAAVVYFGDTAEIALDWTDIAPVPTADAWDAERARLLDEVSEQALRNRFNPDNLGNTNFIAAFQEAERRFSSLPDSRSLRAIVLLTDGEPCVVQGPYQFECGNANAQQRHMNEVYELAHEAFPAPDYRIYVVALDETGNLWQNRRDDWELIAQDPARAGRAETNQQVGIRFLAILNDLVKTLHGVEFVDPIAQGRSVISVPPYQRQLRLSIFKSSQSPGMVEVILPDGTTLTRSNPQLQTSDANRSIEIWTYTNPPPGDWTFVVGNENDRIDVFLELVPFEVTAQVNAGPYNQYETVVLQASLATSDSMPIQSYSGEYPLNALLHLTLPDGTVQEISLTPVGDSLFEGGFTTGQSGDYRVGVTAATEFPPGVLFPVLMQDDVTSFHVEAVTLQTSPLPAGEYLVGNTFDLEAMLQNEVGEVVRLPDMRIAGELRGEQGTVPIALADPDGDGVYTAGLSFDQPGQAQLYLSAVLDVPGTQRFLGEARSAPISVLPSRPVELYLSAPTGDATYYLTDPFPSFTPQAMEIVFETRVTSEDDRLVDVLAFALEPTNTLRVIVERDGQVVAEPTIQVGNQPGEYRAVFENLVQGDYTVRVHAEGELTDRYLLTGGSQDAAATVSYLPHPSYTVFVGAAIGLGIMTVFVAGFAVSRRVRRSSHPLAGSLTITRYEGFQGTPQQVWHVELGGLKSNYAVFTRRHFGREVGMTKMIVRSETEAMTRAKQVKVTILRGKDVLLQDRILSPGANLPIGKSEAPFNPDGAADEPDKLVRFQLQKDADALFGADFTSVFF